ncbi:hypothetical protein KEJ21_05535 [Candidatus Bathyarchaeota archaeon]|nr:hypothetical protein [Candidatus Bathyarchaeota archaeon]MBS7629690.1 hypothetical protein [Candidatus Bathyarchaeota archaeon]MBS7630456.1 hypothetical protein [Candidatus Bathyarchaeota archaeon]
MGWTKYGLAMYIGAILNMIYAFYSLAREEPFLSIILLSNFYIMIYSVANLEAEYSEKIGEAETAVP